MSTYKTTGALRVNGGQVAAPTTPAAMGSTDPRNDDAPKAVGTKLNGNGVFQTNGR